MAFDRLTLHLYRLIAGLFPEEFLQQYGTSLDRAAADVVHDAARRDGLGGVVRLAPRLLADLVTRVATEHVRDAVRDIRYGLRALLAAPGFTGAAVLCLALGIGVTAAMYGQIRSTVFRPVPGVGAPESLVRLQRPTSYVFFEQFQSDRVFSTAAVVMGPVPLVIDQLDGSRQRVWSQIVSPGYFETLETRPWLGRFFGDEERAPGAARAVVISHRAWQGRFGADPQIVGRPIRVNGQLITVIGIASPGFLGVSPSTSAADVWLPTTAPHATAPELQRLDAPLAAAWDVVGRLAAGVSVAGAEAALDAAVRRLEVAYGDPARSSPGPRVQLLAGGRMLPMRDEDLPRAIGFPLVLVALVLLMACASVATMVLARSAARRREIAVRLSLGAAPGRIVRQFATESLLITVLGTAAAVPVALGLLAYFASVTPLLPGYGHIEARLDWSAVALCGAIAAAFTVLFGLAPARSAGRSDISAALKPHAAAAPRRRGRLTLRNALVFQQVAISVLLLLLTTFVVVGWNRSAATDVGYLAEGLHIARLDPIRDGHHADRARGLVERLVTALGTVPGVGAVAVAQSLPTAMSIRDAMLSTKADFISGAGALGAVRVDRVGAGFFAAVGTPVRGGREFTEQDQTDEARVLVVNSVLARQMAPDGDALGRTLEIDEATWTVVGIAGDLRSPFPLAETPPAAFRPVTPAGFAVPARDGIAVVVRTAPGIDADTLVRQTLQAIDQETTVFEVTRMTDELATTKFLARFATTAYGGMGVFGLILAVVGLAGVTAHAVAERRHEIGIRVALGAARGQVLWLVLRESVVIIAAGTVAGLAAAVGLAAVLSAVVESFAETTATSLTDVRLLVGGPALMAAFALVACYLPARESTHIEPTEALRAE
jgi:predicted permease